MRRRRIEEAITSATFRLKGDAVPLFHTVRLAELIGRIADHAENAGDMMRAMVAR